MEVRSPGYSVSDRSQTSVLLGLDVSFQLRRTRLWSVEFGTASMCVCVCGGGPVVLHYDRELISSLEGNSNNHLESGCASCTLHGFSAKHFMETNNYNCFNYPE